MHALLAEFTCLSYDEFYVVFTILALKIIIISNSSIQSKHIIMLQSKESRKKYVSVTQKLLQYFFGRTKIIQFKFHWIITVNFHYTHTFLLYLVHFLQVQLSLLHYSIRVRNNLLDNLMCFHYFDFLPQLWIQWQYVR